MFTRLCLLPLAFVLLPCPIQGGDTRAVKARVDSFGFPLPDGAIARMGSNHFRHIQPVAAIAISADGSLVVGDSHDYAPTPDPFAREAVDRLILDEFQAVFGQVALSVVERWTGIRPAPRIHLRISAGCRNWP